MRLAPSFIGTGLAVREAQRARGLDPDAGSLAARLKANIPLLVPTFLTTIRMTNHLAMSLEARGFGLQKRRTSLLETHFGFGDLFALALVAALLAGAALCPEPPAPPGAPYRRCGRMISPNVKAR